MHVKKDPFQPSKAATRALSVATAFAASLALLTLAGCGEHKEGGATQTAARVNKREITVHQINYVLARQRGAVPGTTDAASREVLERLIDQELAVQQAEDHGLDRDSRVVQQIESAKREILARAYAEKIGDAAPRPTAEEVKQYYNEHPELFSDRRIYNLQEVVIQADASRMEALRAGLQGAKTVSELVDFLKSNEFKFGTNQTVRSAEQLPMGMVQALSRAKPNEAVVVSTPGGATAVFVAASRSQPMDEERSKPLIEQYLLNMKKAKLVNDDLKALRASAKVEYRGAFANPPAAAASAASSPAVEAAVPEVAPLVAPAAAASAASGLDNATINKALGIK